MMNAIVREMKNRNYKAEIVTTIKNGVELTGISLTNGNDLMVPVFYREDDWDTMSASEIADVLEENYANLDRPAINAKDIEDEDFLRKHVQLCIQPKGNEDIVKRDYLDLEVYLRCFVTDEYSFKLKPEMEMPGLFECAVENTKGNLKMDMFGVMHFVTSESSMFGAAYLYYTDIFKDFCKANDINGCFILPSSIHELILVPDDDFSHKGNLDVMVRDANKVVVEPEDYLADHAYYYSVAENNITW